MAGVAGLLFSMWAKGATTGTAVAGGAVSAVGAGIVTELLESVLGMGGMSVGGAGIETATSGIGGPVVAAIGSMLSLGKQTA